MLNAGRLNDRATATAATLLAAVGVTSALVLILPAGHPVRVVAGLVLFLGLPGIGFRDAFVRPSARLASWEGVALAGALGLTVSSLACVLIVAVGLRLSAISVTASCAALASSAAVVIAAGPGVIHRRRARVSGLPVLAVAFCSVLLGAFIGSAAANFEPPEYFTVFAIADPVAARSAVAALADGSSEALVRLTIESHEFGTEHYRILVAGEAPGPEFTLRPSESLEVDARIHARTGGSIEIRLLKAGATYRLLRLNAP